METIVLFLKLIEDCDTTCLRGEFHLRIVKEMG